MKRLVVLCLAFVWCDLSIAGDVIHRDMNRLLAEQLISGGSCVDINGVYESNGTVDEYQCEYGECNAALSHYRGGVQFPGNAVPLSLTDNRAQNLRGYLSGHPRAFALTQSNGDIFLGYSDSSGVIYKAFILSDGVCKDGLLVFPIYEARNGGGEHGSYPAGLGQYAFGKVKGGDFLVLNVEELQSKYFLGMLSGTMTRRLFVTHIKKIQ